MYGKLKNDFFEKRTLTDLLNELMSHARSIDHKRQIVSYIEENYFSPNKNLIESKRRLEEQDLPEVMKKNILSAQKTAVSMAASLMQLDSINGIADIDKIFNQMREVHGQEAPSQDYEV
ncbi:hypothetical protein IPJ63_02890 [Candidatus Nomurabacteria bacterium]|nr:MAG: hypothetical protein IPJ63_02890 [Candidatus Nomurabacteria bacterium]